jgi:predicted glycoside hydrolase/deacetylase ChbG (UPF0249 family)
MPPELIINADDFGASAPINKAIILAFQQGWIHSASIMPTMPAFGEACALVGAHRLSGRIGLHLSLTLGKALSAGIRRYPRLCTPAGQLCATRRALWRLTAAERLAVAEEVEAQYQACLAQGVVPAHVDTHQHAHYCWPVGSILLRLARQHDAVPIRLYRNWPGAGSLFQGLYARMFNRRLVASGLARSEWFAHLDDILRTRLLPRQHRLEIMTHPDLDARGAVVDGARAPAETAPRFDQQIEALRHLREQP